MVKKTEFNYDAGPEMDDLEKRVDRCRIQYELYFNGVQKREPMRMRKELLNRLARLRRQHIRRVQDRFRLESIASRIAVLNRYWERVNKEKENGTYYKDRARARRVMEKNNPKLPIKNPETADQEANEDHAPVYTLEDIEKSDLGSKRKAAQRAKVQKNQDKSQGAMDQKKIENLYKSLLSAKQKCAQSTNGLTLQAVQKTIEQQLPKLREKGYKNIDFRVVVKEGKASLKAVVKRKKQPSS